MPNGFEVHGELTLGPPCVGKRVLIMDGPVALYETDPVIVVLERGYFVTRSGAYHVEPLDETIAAAIARRASKA